MNVIIKDEKRIKEENFIINSFGVDRSDPSMKEAAEVAAARTEEAVQMGNEPGRRYFI